MLTRMSNEELIDHIQPVWAGGTTAPENLRVFCRAHNQYRYKAESGLVPLRNSDFLSHKKTPSWTTYSRQNFE